MRKHARSRKLTWLFAVALVVGLPSLAAAQGTVAVPFQGTCTDPEDGDISASLVWSSDLQGPVGSGGSGTMNLAEGTHVITATCDDAGPSGPQSASVTVNISIDEAPSVIIIQPVDGQTYSQ